MGYMTHLQLVTEALELAGNISLATRGQTWLGLVLRHLNEKFSFPFGPNRKGIATVTAGQGELTVGSRSGGSADVFQNTPVRGIQRVMLATSADLSNWEELNRETIETVSLPTLGNLARTGRPTAWVAEPNSPPDGFDLSLSPVPDQSYTLLVVCDMVGLGSPTYSASAVDDYPDDLTVLQGVYAMALRHQQDERAGTEWDEFKSMAKQDRVRYGNMNGTYSQVGLGGPHKTRSPNNRGPGWMGPV